jgi:NMD protein affecting ribosome stability and mRNA decay
MSVSSKQIFKCPNCGDTIETIVIEMCDHLEGNRCQMCNQGRYRWIEPVKPIESQRAGVLPNFDDIGAELDAAFDEIIEE